MVQPIPTNLKLHTVNVRTSNLQKIFSTPRARRSLARRRPINYAQFRILSSWHSIGGRNRRVGRQANYKFNPAHLPLLFETQSPPATALYNWYRFDLPADLQLKRWPLPGYCSMHERIQAGSGGGGVNEEQFFQGRPKIGLAPRANSLDNQS